jgi:hypothetical protein
VLTFPQGEEYDVSHNDYRSGNDRSDSSGGMRRDADLSGLLEFIVKSMVDYPDEVKIHEVKNERSVILEIKVNEADVGKVIGKNGRIIRSLRLLMKAAAVQARLSVGVEIVN